MDLVTLKNARSHAKASITRTFNWLTDNILETDVSRFLSRKESLQEAFKKYSDVQDAIEDSISESSDTGLHDTENRDDVELKYFDSLALIHKKLNNNVQSVPCQQVSQQNVSDNEVSDVKLPKIEIKMFTGIQSEWRSFSQLFDTLITKNTKLTDIQRLIYLKSYLRGEPLKLIESLDVIHENFKVALDTVSKRYDNKNCIINSYFSSLLDTPPITKCTASNFREFVSNCKKNLDCLKNLKYDDKKLFDLLIINLLQKQLDFYTKQAFENSRDEKELPTLTQFFEFLEKKCVNLENLSSIDARQNRKVDRTSLHAHTDDVLQPQISCIFCGDLSHKIYTCHKFKSLALSDKTKFVKSKRLCFNCLGTKHMSQNCNSTRSCYICKRKHNTMLHEYHESNRNTNFQSNSQIVRNPRNNSRSDQSVDQSTPRPQNSLESLDISNSENPPIISAITTRSTHILLATAQVTLFSQHGIPIQVRALLDGGSQNSFISERLADKLQLQPINRRLNISGISQNSITSTKMLSIAVHSNVHLNQKFNISCAVLKTITCRLPQIKILAQALNIPNDIHLADPNFSSPGDIDLLIGADCYYDLLLEGIINLGNNLPVLQKTHLGWVIAGSIPSQCIVNNSHSLSNLSIEETSSNENVSLFVQTSDLNNLMTRFWSLEEIPKQTPLSIDDEQAENDFISTSKILQNGTFQVNMPLKSPSEHRKLGDSFTVASKRFNNLEKRFEKDASLFSDYKNFIHEYVALGHGRYVPLTLYNSQLETKYFIPHLCVIREASATTKLRVVFDASCKTSSGYSLNDITLKGFQVQPDLYDILCRFRLYKYVLTADIQKMYRQVKINPDQGFLQNILWRDDPSESLKCIELLTVTYGTNCAPYLATRVLKEVALINSSNFPLASEALLNQCYVDDILGGSNDYDTLKILYTELNVVLQKHGFQLHKWNSNSINFMQDISKEIKIDFNLNLGNNCNKVLGLKWTPFSDTFHFSLPIVSIHTKVTKRTVLSTLSQCFDPLGLVNPIIVQGKILMQKLWLQKVDWDSEITDDSLLNDWKRFIEHASDLNQLKIPRHVFLDKSVTMTELHGFADASVLAYAACIYIRTKYSDGTTSCNLFSSKSRIAPIKSISIPKLELCAMLLLSNLTKKVVCILNGKINISSVNLWTDSQIALCWCKSHASRWTTFVSNRVSQIQELTAEFHWRHVRSADNAADILSRGMCCHDLVKSTVWWHGPDFLSDPNLSPVAPICSMAQPKELIGLPEERTVSHVTLENPDWWFEIFSKFSSFLRLRRIVAYCLRFVNSCKRNSNKVVGPLTIHELDSSQCFILKTLQNNCFAKEIAELRSDKPLSNKNIVSLQPFIDHSGILRVGGRLHNADIPFQQKHPVLLPSKNSVVALILKHEHICLGHAGAQTVLSNVRLKFWPLNGLKEIKKIIRNCTMCHRFRARAAEQLMGTLPPDRVTINKPFTNVGIDFAGPVTIKESRLRKSICSKAYIAIFVCMNSKAVHIELVSNLSTEAFILSLKRFISRRGNPSKIYSDNATNFKGASNTLHELYTFFRNTASVNCITEFLSTKEISWKFIPPSSPHWGGLWEAGVRSIKYHLNRIIGKSVLSFEMMTTILCQIEGILNSRPLCALSNDPSDFSSLTPGHFIIGCPLTAYPEKNLLDTPVNRLSFWQRCSQMQQLFWKRWSIEYLNRLQNRPKWLYPCRNLKVNDLVLLKEDNTIPLHWPLARIVEVITGSDGKVRVVKLRTKNGTFTRPITKVCPLPLDSNPASAK